MLSNIGLRFARWKDIELSYTPFWGWMNVLYGCFKVYFTLQWDSLVWSKEKNARCICRSGVLMKWMIRKSIKCKMHSHLECENINTQTFVHQIKLPWLTKCRFIHSHICLIFVFVNKRIVGLFGVRWLYKPMPEWGGKETERKRTTIVTLSTEV